MCGLALSDSFLNDMSYLKTVPLDCILSTPHTAPFFMCLPTNESSNTRRHLLEVINGYIEDQCGNGTARTWHEEEVGRSGGANRGDGGVSIAQPELGRHAVRLVHDAEDDLRA